MDTVADRFEYALALREKGRMFLVAALQEENGRRRREGLPPVPWANKERVYEFNPCRTKPVPVEFVEAVSNVLDVRPAWLAFGSGPCEAGVPADPVRELYLVDGIMEVFSPPGDPADRNRIRREFQAGFGNPENFDGVSPTVHVVFANYLARYFGRCREKGDTRPDSPLWRGQEASQSFTAMVRKVRDGGKASGTPDGRASWTAAALWGLGSWEVGRPDPNE